MNKADLANYLVNLHFLMDAQRANGQDVSTTIGDEYRRGWETLKQTITKEQSDETRRSPEHDYARPAGDRRA